MITTKKKEQETEPDLDDPIAQYNKALSSKKKKEILKGMLSGTMFSLRLEAVKLRVQAPGMSIRRQ